MSCQPPSSIPVQIPTPRQLDLVIACDDRAWDDLMALAGQAGSSRVIFGATNPNNHSTFLRGTPLLGQDRVMTPKNLVTHELAHIYLHSSDARRVEDRAFKLGSGPIVARRP